VRQEYCFNRNGCDEFQIGGSGVDFFDENVAGSGTTRCRFLASFLVTHHPSLDEVSVSPEPVNIFPLLSTEISGLICSVKHGFDVEIIPFREHLANNYAVAVINPK
jgi:hypothetical protein